MRAQWLVVLMCVGGCQKKAEAPAPPVAVKAAPLPGDLAPKRAEVEITGQWKRGAVAGGAVEVVAQAEPCVPVPASPRVFGRASLDKEGPLFAEFFIPQGTVGHACVYARDDAGVVLGVAAYEKNPVRFEGEGEVEVGPFNAELSGP